MIDVAPLFTSAHLGELALPNRIVVAPMTRARSPGQVPGADVAAYYRRRAAAGVGLIITEEVASSKRSNFNQKLPIITATR